MAGISYGKGAVVDETQVRWITPAQLEVRIARREPLRLCDARDEKEFVEGSLPGAVLLGQTCLMFSLRGKVKGLLDSIVAGEMDIVLFANTGGPNSGMQAGRDVYVMAYLHELGVPYSRMWRLDGGVFGWRESGRPLPLPEDGAPSVSTSSLGAFLHSAGLGHLSDTLSGETLEGCAEDLGRSRPAFLQRLKELGVDRLADRQALANAIGKARRGGELPGGS